MSNSRELSELASQLTVQGDLITLPNLQILGSINTATLDVSGNFSVLGNATIGNAGTDTLTVNSAISYTGTLTGSTGVINIGSGQIYKDASGNLGVGTSSPTAALDVEGLGNTVAAHIFTSDNVLDATASLVFGTTPGSRSKASVSMVNTSTGNGAGALVFSTNNGTTLTERARLDASGNLLLGTTTANGLITANAVSGNALFSLTAATNANRAYSLYSSKDSGGTAVNMNVGSYGDGVSGIVNVLTAHPLVFSTNNTERMRLDASGNLGLGVTPSAWRTSQKAIEIGGTFSGISGGLNTLLYSNVYTDSSNVDRYKANGAALLYGQLSVGNHVWSIAPSGTAGNAITFTQAMTLTQGGNLLVGRTGALNNGVVDVLGDGKQGFVSQVTNNGNSNFQGFSSAGIATFQVTGAGDAQAVSISKLGAGDLIFNVATEAARITSARYFKASNTGVYVNAAGAFHEFTGADNTETLLINTTSTTAIATHTRLPVGSTGFHFIGELAASGTVYQVLANGNVQNTNNSYGAISDVKHKEGIVDAPSYLDRFMQVRFRNFNFIGSDLKQFGVIAQELETVFPSLVDESPDMEQVTRTRIIDVPAVEEVLDEEGNVVTPAQPATTREEEYTESVPTGTFTKSVKYSVLAQMQGKVIQELNDKIVNLEDQLQQVLTRLSNLENK